MKKHYIKTIFIVLITTLFIFNCPKEKKDNKLILGLAFLSSNNKNASPSIAAQYPNSVAGDSASIQATTGASSAVDQAMGSATSAAETAFGNLLEESRKEVISKSIASKANTCDGTNRNISGNYKTVSTVTTSPSTSIYLTSGSYLITPDLTLSGSYNCTNPRSTGFQNLTVTGSITITYTNATIKYFDIEDFVKNGKFTFKTLTLNGSISRTNINRQSNSNSNSTLSGTTTTTTYSSNSTNSSISKSSNLVVDGGAPASFEFTTTSQGITTQIYKSIPNLFTSCFVSYETNSGGRNVGIYNGKQVSTSSNFTSDDFKKFLVAIGATLTICPN